MGDTNEPPGWTSRFREIHLDIHGDLRARAEVSLSPERAPPEVDRLLQWRTCNHSACHWLSWPIHSDEALVLDAQPCPCRSLMEDRMWAGSASMRQVADFPETIWRIGWESNPRSPCGDAGFQDRCIQPLCHLSGPGRRCYQIRGSIRALP